MEVEWSLRMSPELAAEVWTTAALLEAVLSVLIWEGAPDLPRVLRTLLRP